MARINVGGKRSNVPSWYTGAKQGGNPPPPAGNITGSTGKKKQTGGTYYDQGSGKFVTPASQFRNTLDELSGVTAFRNAVPAWASEARFANAIRPAAPAAPSLNVGGGVAAPPSYYQAAGGAQAPARTRYTTRAGRDEGGYSIPVPYVQPAPATSDYMPTSMPIIEREMDWLNQNTNSPYLPSWVFGDEGGQDWWGNYRRRGGGGGGYGGGSYVPNWYTGLYQLNANR